MSNLTSEQQILIAAAWADGRLDDSEAEILRRVLRSAELSDAQIEQALLSPPAGLEALIGSIPASGREKTMKSVLEMCFADDILEVEEFELIELLAQKLELDEDTMERLRHEAGGA